MEYNSENINFLVIYETTISVNGNEPLIIKKAFLDFLLGKIGDNNLIHYEKTVTHSEIYINNSNIIQIKNTADNSQTKISFKNQKYCSYFSKPFIFFQQKIRELKLKKLINAI